MKKIILLTFILLSSLIFLINGVISVKAQTKQDVSSFEFENDISKDNFTKPVHFKFEDTSELNNLIYTNVAQLLRFYKELLDKETLQIIQKIEHHTFWIFKHLRNTSIEELALEIKEIVDANKEYQIYKILVGFQSVFEDWELAEEKEGMAYEKERKVRSSKAKQFAEAIDASNYEEWAKRSEREALRFDPHGDNNGDDGAAGPPGYYRV